MKKDIYALALEKNIRNKFVFFKKFCASCKCLVSFERMWKLEEEEGNCWFCMDCCKTREDIYLNCNKTDTVKDVIYKNQIRALKNKMRSIKKDLVDIKNSFSSYDSHDPCVHNFLISQIVAIENITKEIK